MKQRNKRAILTFLAIILMVMGGSNLLEAQTPGYRGKHWSVFYDLGVSPGLHTNYQKVDPNIYVGLKHSGSLDWVFSRNGSVGLSYKRFRTGTGISKDAGLAPTLVRVSGHGFGTYLKVYPFLKQGNIAPLGTWYKAEYMLLTYRSFEKDPGTDSNELPYVGNSATSALLFSVGHNLLIKDIIFLNGGLQTGIVLGMLNQQSDFHQINTRLGGLFAFNVNLGVGVLMF